MKNKMLGKFLVLFAICMLLPTILACSEKVASGGTVDENTIAEKEIAELHVDSVKVFADAEPAEVGNHKIDSIAYWYEIKFHSERESYFAYTEDDPYLYCYVNVYQEEFGVQSQISIQDVGEFGYTFFLTSNDNGIIFHEKLDNIYFDKSRCEKDLSEFEKNCNDEGGSLFLHVVNCEESGLHLTCSSAKGYLVDNANGILKDFAEKMKTRCLEK